MKDKSNTRLLSFIFKIISIISSILIFTVSKYAFIFFLFSMLPTITTFTIDKKSNKYASSTICAFNLIGITSSIANLLNGSSIDDEAQNMLSDPIVWLNAYGCTFIGLLLIWIIPKFTSNIFVAKVKYRLQRIHNEQLKMVKDWGNQIQNDYNKE